MTRRNRNFGWALREGKEAMRRIAAVPALLTVILASTHIALAADNVPELNIDPTCHGAAMAMPVQDRHEDVCKRDENEARSKLQQEWPQFSQEQRTHCVTLTKLGGPPSYVELLTCLEMAKAVADKPITGQKP